MEIYKVVSLLKDKKGKELSIAEIEKETGVKINATLLETLQGNESLKCGTREKQALDVDDLEASDSTPEIVFSFKRKYPFSNRVELLAYLKENPILIEEPELLLTYKNVDRDLERLVRSRKLLCVMPSPKKKIYYYNSAPITKLSPELVKAWDKTMQESVRDIVAVRQQLVHKYGVPLADLPFDEDAFLLKQIQARRKREEARKRKKGKRGSAVGDGRGGGTKRRTNDTLQDMKLELVVGDKDNKIFVAMEDEDLSDLEEDERGQGGMLTPELPPEALALAEQILRRFYDDDCIVVFDALLKEDRKSTPIVNRRENELAERLDMPVKHLRSVLLRLKANYFVTEKVFKMRGKEDSNYVRHYSCWLISFNDFFDCVNFRLQALEEVLKTEVKDAQKTLYFCPEASCAREYGIDDVPALFSNDNNCLTCGGELISSGAEADDTKKFEEALNEMKSLKTKIKNLIGEGKGKPLGVVPNAPARKLPGGNKRAAATTKKQTNQNQKLLDPSTSRKVGLEGYGAPLLAGDNANNNPTDDAILGPIKSEELLKGDETGRIDFDNPYPIHFSRNGKIYLPLIVKTWRQVQGMKQSLLRDVPSMSLHPKKSHEHKKKRPHKKPRVEGESAEKKEVQVKLEQQQQITIKKEGETAIKQEDLAKIKKEKREHRHERKRKLEGGAETSTTSATQVRIEGQPVGSTVVGGEGVMDERALKKARREERQKKKLEKEQRRQERAEKRKRRDERRKEKEAKALALTQQQGNVKEEKGKEKEKETEKEKEKEPETAEEKEEKEKLLIAQQLGGGVQVETGGMWAWSYSTTEAHRFLQLVAELTCYHSQVLEWEITERSLFTARKYEGLEGGEIAACLERLSGKHIKDFPPNLIRLLRKASSSDAYFESIVDRPESYRKLEDYFSASIILKGHTYYLQSGNQNLLKSVQPYSRGGAIEPVQDSTKENPLFLLELKAETSKDAADMISNVKDYLFNRRIPIIEEYDFLSNRWATDSVCENLVISLNEEAKARDYQKRSAYSLFWDNKAHSAILVLPCGAGKTLVGITVASIIKKCVLVFCTSTMAVNQWREQFIKWTDCDKSAISRFTSATRKKNEWNFNCGVLITTYNMFASVTKRSEHSQRMIEKVRERTWGLMILDEVHLAPAQTFRRVTTEFRAHVKLGLTATMVREDDLIEELPKLVGPRLFEVDLVSLKVYRHVAIVHCRQIICPLTSQFKEAYRRASSPEERRLIYITNPNKARICVSLVQAHLQQKHKCLIFCDDLFGLQWFSKVLKSDYIDGSTPQEQREKWLNRFKTTTKGAFVLISKVGDHSIDLPEANVVIQVGVVDGSRMQEAQRLGRVQRKKAEAVDAHFYAIISDETEEVGYSQRRKSFMEEHGYLYTSLKYQDYMQPDSMELVNEGLQRDVLQAIKEELKQSGQRALNRASTEYIVEDVNEKSKPKKKGTARDRLTKKIAKRKITEEDM